MIKGWRNNPLWAEYYARRQKDRAIRDIDLIKYRTESKIRQIDRQFAEKVSADFADPEVLRAMFGKDDERIEDKPPS